MRVAWQNRFRRSLCKISATQDLCKRFLNWQDLFKTSSQDLCLRSLYRVPAQHPCKWSLGKTFVEQISWQDRRKRPHKIPIQGLYVMSLGKISVQGLYKICWQDCCPCARSLWEVSWQVRSWKSLNKMSAPALCKLSACKGKISARNGDVPKGKVNPTYVHGKDCTSQSARCGCWRPQQQNTKGMHTVEMHLQKMEDWGTLVKVTKIAGRE